MEQVKDWDMSNPREFWGRELAECYYNEVIRVHSSSDLYKIVATLIAGSLGLIAVVTRLFLG